MNAGAKVTLLTLLLVACGGGGGGGAAAPSSGGACGDENGPAYDLNSTTGQDEAVPCSTSGKDDLSGKVHLESTPDGVAVSIEANDDDFEAGKDTVTIKPQGPNGPSVQVALTKTAKGYAGKTVIKYDDLPKLNDEGSKIEIDISDADKSGKPEEVKLKVAVSTGKSCEKAVDENPQSITMGAKQSKDLTSDQLGAPMRDSSFMSKCDLPDASKAEICVAVKSGKPLGVSVKVAPSNNKIAACIDRSVRNLKFPTSDKLDVVKQSF